MGTRKAQVERVERPKVAGNRYYVFNRAPLAAEFPLYLRVPRWCAGFRAGVNGKGLDAAAEPGKYVRIERTWKDGDTVEIAMPAELAVTRWPRTGAATVDRGPLSYSVKIGERWQRCGGTDEWPEWEVLPTTPWNYGLVLNAKNPTAGMKVKEKKVAAEPWTPDAAPLEVRVRAKRIPNWGLQNETVEELQVSPIRSDEPAEEITMIPLGCARLRMACLPVIGTRPDAQE